VKYEVPTISEHLLFILPHRGLSEQGVKDIVKVFVHELLEQIKKGKTAW
jgi:Fe-S cluster assembly scaffold protein SufB